MDCVLFMVALGQTGCLMRITSRNWMGVSAMLVYKNSPRYRYYFMGALSCNYKEILISGY